MKILILAAAVAALGPKTVLAKDGAAQVRCEARLNLELVAQNKLGYLPNFEAVRAKPFSKEEGVERLIVTAKHPRFGMDLAFIDYQVFDGGNTVEVEKIDVLNTNNFRKGLSNLLFAEMIERQPAVTRIRGRVADVNLMHLLTHMRGGMNCVDAFMLTPGFLTAKHFGFTKVSGGCNPTTGEYNFVMEREQPH